MKFTPGDQVKITAGKDKGKSGEITRVFPDKDKVLVKGINVFKRHIKKREGVEGGIISLPKPFTTAKIALICPTCNQPTRVGYKTPKQGKKIRFCKKCSAEIVKKTKDSAPDKKSTSKDKSKKTD